MTMTRARNTTIAACAVLAGFGGTAYAAPLSLSETFDNPTPDSFGQFGTSVALDGGQVLIGAPFDDTNGFIAGRAHLFDAKTGALLRTFEDPTPTSTDQFGTSVAFDGGRVLIGAPRDDTKGSDVGQAHLFDATTGDLLQTFDDPTPTGDLFGSSVALDSGQVLIGARSDDTRGFNVGQAHLFDGTTGDLLQTFDDPTPTRGDQFGFTVALDGGQVLVGAPADDTSGGNVGQAHLFDATTGDLLQTFDDPTLTGGDQFGFAVALDGSQVLIGAHFDDRNGFGVGEAHLFDAANGALLHTLDDPTPTVDDRFGFSVALGGGRVLIGAPRDKTAASSSFLELGQAHLFDAATGALLHTLDDPTPTANDRFGFSVALAGNQALIGAQFDASNGSRAGQAHLFTAATTTTAIPEPSTMVLLVGGLFSAGLLGSAGAARRRHLASPGAS